MRRGEANQTTHASKKGTPVSRTSCNWSCKPGDYLSCRLVKMWLIKYQTSSPFRSSKANNAKHTNRFCELVQFYKVFLDFGFSRASGDLCKIMFLSRWSNTKCFILLGNYAEMRRHQSFPSRNLQAECLSVVLLCHESFGCVEKLFHTATPPRVPGTGPNILIPNNTNV